MAGGGRTVRAPSVTALPNGFRAVSRLPDAGALGRVRAALLALAAEGGLAAAGFERLPSWQGLAPICATPWLAGARGPSAAGARVLRRRLRWLGTPSLRVAALLQQPSGARVHARGRCAPLAPTEIAADVWRVDTVRGDDGAWLIEEGHDFALADDDGSPALVMASGGHLVGAAALRAGDEVSVFGVVDVVPDQMGLAPSPRGRGGVIARVRGAAELPLLVTAACFSGGPL